LAPENILVKIARIGERSEEYALTPGSTVEDLLDASGMSLLKDEEIQINGSPADEDTPLRDGDRVFIVPSTTNLEKY